MALERGKKSITFLIFYDYVVWITDENRCLKVVKNCKKLFKTVVENRWIKWIKT